VKFAIIFLTLLITLLHSKESYELGDGVQIASLPIYIGGYTSAQYKKADNDVKYSIEDIALLNYGNYKRFSYLTEIEYKNLYSQEVKDDTSIEEQDTHLYIERLYVDYTFNENFTARAGKYISPIGFWNLLPINVLRDTTSDPISTNIIFPEATTGLYCAYTSIQENELKIDVMLQNNEDFDNKYNNYKINKHYGLGITYNQGEFTSKINVGYFNKLYRYIDDEFQTNGSSNESEENEEDDDYELRSKEEQNLYYVNLGIKYDTLEYQILSELGHQESSNGAATNYAFYLQGLYRVTPKQSAIFRFEAYDDAVSNKRDEFGVFAYTYRPLYPVAFKTEYQLHSLSQFNKLLISFSVLF